MSQARKAPRPEVGRSRRMPGGVGARAMGASRSPMPPPKPTGSSSSFPSGHRGLEPLPGLRDLRGAAGGHWARLPR
eukprot:4421882-Pyramimonas_sp.AAC.1